MIPLERPVCIVCNCPDSKVEATGKDYMYGSCANTFSMTRCCECGHLYLNPRPTPEAASIIYPETYSSYQGILAEPKTVMRWVKRTVVMHRFRKAVSGLKNGAVLEIGCGDGDLLISIQEAFPDLKLTGLDFRFQTAIQKRLHDRGIETITDLAERASLPVNSYDVIVMNQLIEHLWDPDAVLIACHKALKAEGILTLETPNPNSYDRRIFHAGLWGNYYFPRHLNLFSPDGISRLLERNGFRILRRIDLLAPLCWIFSMHSIAGRYSGMAWFKKLFPVASPIPVAFFAAIDLFAKVIGFQTSNQKVIASRV